jgi:hypothetical protein
MCFILLRTSYFLPSSSICTLETLSVRVLLVQRSRYNYILRKQHHTYFLHMKEFCADILLVGATFYQGYSRRRDRTTLMSGLCNFANRYCAPSCKTVVIWHESVALFISRSWTNSLASLTLPCLADGTVWTCSMTWINELSQISQLIIICRHFRIHGRKLHDE